MWELSDSLVLLNRRRFGPKPPRAEPRSWRAYIRLSFGAPQTESSRCLVKFAILRLELVGKTKRASSCAVVTELLTLRS